MVKQGSSAALILVATGLLMVVTGCETSKHAEVMGNESFAAQQRMAAMEETESGGIPIGDQGISQTSITGVSPEGPPGATLRGLDRATALEEGLPTVGDGGGMASTGEVEIPKTVSPGPPPIPDSFPKGNRGPAAGFGPVDPAMPSFRDGEETLAAEVPTPSAAPEPESAYEPGPTGYEGQTLEPPSSPPSGFIPSGPPMPTFGEEPSPEPDTMVAVPDVMEQPSPPPAESMETEAMPTETMPMESGDMGSMTSAPLTEIADVFFDFDKYAIRSDAAATLVQNARILQGELRGTNVLIEGHCDERGTEEYNMILGERRAQSVKNYLVDLGVPASTIQIVSYGKERPFCTEHYDACWDQNRRGHFVIQ